MSTPAEDKDLEEYLRRKSALSMGYRKIYVEAPPPELDRAITARARRALRWLLPAIISAVIVISAIVSLNVGVTNLMTATVNAERNAKKLLQERKEQEERDRLNQPVSVVIDAKNIAKQEAKDAAIKLKAEQEAYQAAREQWLAKIEALKAQGKNAEAAAELRWFKAAYPDSEKK